MTIIPTVGPPPPEEHSRIQDVLRDELRRAHDTIEKYGQELDRKNAELRHADQIIGHLQHEMQRSKDSNNDLQNDLNNVRQQLEDAKKHSEVCGEEHFGVQVHTFSISEMEEKVTALNEEIFQAAATLGDALIHKRHVVSQTVLDAAAVESREMVGKKLTKILITQSRQSEPEVNPLLVQVVLQIFMVKFCVSKIQSWYPGDSAIGEFLAALYSEIRSTGKKHRH